MKFRYGSGHFRAAFILISLLSPVTRADPDDAELLRALALLDAKERAALAADPALLKQVVRLTHAQQLLLSEARAGRWEERPEVQAKLERARNTALAESWLQSIFQVIK